MFRRVCLPAGMANYQWYLNTAVESGTIAFDFVGFYYLSTFVNLQKEQRRCLPRLCSFCIVSREETRDETYRLVSSVYLLFTIFFVSTTFPSMSNV